MRDIIQWILHVFPVDELGSTPIPVWTGAGVPNPEIFGLVLGIPETLSPLFDLIYCPDEDFRSMDQGELRERARDFYWRSMILLGFPSIYISRDGTRENVALVVGEEVLVDFFAEMLLYGRGARQFPFVIGGVALPND